MRLIINTLIRAAGSTQLVVTSPYYGKTSEENFQAKLAAIGDSIKALQENPKCKDRVDSELLAAAGVVATFSPQGGYLAGPVLMAGKAIFDALKSFKKNTPTILEKINLCRSNELMKEARSHLCGVAEANAKFKYPFPSDSPPDGDGKFSLHDAAQQLITHTQEKMKNDPTFELLTALDTTEKSLSVLNEKGKGRDRVALKDLKESLSHLMDGLRCTWRMSGTCKNDEPKCLAVLTASEDVKAVNKNRCKAFVNWSEEIQSPIFGEGPGNTDTRKRILTEMGAELSDGYFGGIKADISDFESGPVDWSTRSSINGNNYQSVNVAWALHNEKTVVPGSNILEDEKAGIDLAQEAASYIPDLSDKKSKDLEAMCSALPCLWGKGKEELYTEDQKPNPEVLNLKSSSGYSPFDYQDPSKLSAQGIIPGIQGKGDLGFSKLVNYCKANFADKSSCVVSCGVSFLGAFCEKGTGDCDTQTGATQSPIRKTDAQTTVSPAN